MTKGTAWKAAGVGLLFAAAGAGAAFAQAGIATAPDPDRLTVNPPVASSQPFVAGPGTATIRAGGGTHKARRAHKAASAASH
jgi:hypothetical protein